MKYLKMFSQYIKNFFRTEGGKLREMNFTDKRQYIWEYYKLPIIATIIVVSVIVWFSLSSSKDDYLYIAWFGHPIPTQQLTMLSGSLSVIVDDPDNEMVAITSYVPTGDTEMNMALQQRLSAMLQLGAIDLVIVERQELGLLAGTGVIIPIDILLAEINNSGLRQNFYERLNYNTFVCEVNNEERSGMMGISLAGSQIFERYFISTDNLYLAITFNTERYDRIIELLEILLEHPVG